jgi:DUF971 family protein
VTETAWPTEIRLLEGKHTLAISFDDGTRYELPAEYLRVESPSAEVQGHRPEEKTILGGKRNVKIMSVEPIGTYAVRLGFDDGHNTGLFEWGYLRRLGDEREAIWGAYLQALAARGLTREK